MMNPRPTHALRNSVPGRHPTHSLRSAAHLRARARISSVHILARALALASATLWTPLGGLAGCASSEAHGRGEGESLAVPVEVRLARPTTRRRTAHAVALAAPWRQVTVRAEAGARVTRLRVDVGDTVRAGQRLATLDASVAWRAFRTSRVSIRRADVSLRKARLDLARTRRLVRTGDAPQAQLDQAQAAHDSAVAARDLARAQAAQAGQQLGHYEVRAPFDAVVSGRAVEIGDYVAPGTGLLTLVDSRTLRLVIALTPVDALSLHPGDPAEVTVLGRRRRATVFRIRPATADATQRLEVELALPNPLQPPSQQRAAVFTTPASDSIPAGVVARVRLSVGAPERVWPVPPQAVVRRAGAHEVFVVRHHRAVSVAVRLLDSDARAIYVKPDCAGALRAGDALVVAGAARLGPGAQVVIATRVESEARGAKPRGAKPRGAKPRGAKPRGAKPRGAKPRGAKPRGAKP